MTNIDYEDLFDIETDTYNVLYKGINISNKIGYTDVANLMGVRRSGWGWGTTFLDVNNDGFQDLAATNGVDNIGDSSKFWLNQGGNSFLDYSDFIGFNDQLDGTALISFDYDQDGDLDMLQTAKPYVNQNTSIRLLKNDCTNCGQYITIRPRMAGNNHFAIGSTVKVKAGAKTMMRLITAGNSFYAQEPAEAHFGLGSASMVDEVKIIWPGGAETIVENIAANQILEITDSNILHIPRFYKSDKTGNLVDLEWNHIRSTETLFEIETANNPSFNNASLYEIQATERQFAFEDNTEETIFLRIRAKNDQLVSAWSPLTWIGDYIPAPSDLKIVNDDVFNPILQWKDNSTNESAFLLERSEDESFSFVEISRIDANVTQFQENDLQLNKSYYYRILASDEVDLFSEYSDTLRHDVLEVQVSPTLIYPNPSSSYIFLPLDKSEVQVADASGKRFTLYQSQEGHYLIEHLPVGVYFVITEFSKELLEDLRFIKIATP